MRSFSVLFLVVTVGCVAGSDVFGDGDGDRDVDIPVSQYCAPADGWEPIADDFEGAVLDLVNQRRSEGANCGGQTYSPAPALVIDGALRCAARVHSRDMEERGFFDHTNPDGDSPFDRMLFAGYDWRAAGENIAGGQPTPEAVVDAWMNSSGHCSNIMSPDFADIGIGYWDAGTMWTQVFGRR